MPEIYSYDPSSTGEDMGFITYQAYQHSGGGLQKVTHDSVATWHLHMVHQLESKVEASYEDGSSALTKLGSLGSDIIKGIKGVADTGTFDAKGMLNNVMQHAAERGATTSAKALDSLVSGTLGGLGVGIGEGEIVNAVNKQLGSIENPYLEQFFSGIGFRSFSFQHKLVAFSREDSYTIHSLINAFKYYASPALSPKAYRMEYPAQFDIQFSFPDGEHGGITPWLPKIKRSVLESVEVNHTASDAWALHDTGAPADIELTLQFKEVELAYKDHYRHQPNDQPPPDYIGAAWNSAIGAWDNRVEHLNNAKNMADRIKKTRITFGLG